MKPLQIPLEQGKFYHIFNRGNNGDNLFYNNENYKFFLRRLNEYLSDCIEVYAFCLLPNHFHLLIRLKDVSSDASSDALHLKDAKRLNAKYDPTSLAFLKLFTSYSKAVNKQQNRHGSLFENPFKRKWVDNVQYFTNLVFYIHANPQLHGICDDFRQYQWSSYDRILINKPSKLKKEEVICWFDNKENYLEYHNQLVNVENININDLTIE